MTGAPGITLEQAVREVLAFGATSGWNILAGFLYGDLKAPLLNRWLRKKVLNPPTVGGGLCISLKRHAADFYFVLGGTLDYENCHKSGEYYDSVTLLQYAQGLIALAGIEDAAVVMERLPTRAYLKQGICSLPRGRGCLAGRPCYCCACCG
jgi:hypothetical protein